MTLLLVRVGSDALVALLNEHAEAGLVQPEFPTSGRRVEAKGNISGRGWDVDQK